MHYLPRMKHAAFLVALPAQALAWSFDPAPVCTLTHDFDTGSAVVTYDPVTEDYAITLTLTDAAWPEAPSFGIAFAGPRGLQIGTNRHVLSDDGQSLTVTDRGFGNVLDGLEYNNVARAVSGERILDVPLDGAAEPVRAFRACTASAFS